MEGKRVIQDLKIDSFRLADPELGNIQGLHTHLPQNGFVAGMGVEGVFENMVGGIAREMS